MSTRGDSVASRAASIDTVAPASLTLRADGTDHWTGHSIGYAESDRRNVLEGVAQRFAHDGLGDVRYLEEPKALQIQSGGVLWHYVVGATREATNCAERFDLARFVPTVADGQFERPGNIAAIELSPFDLDWRGTDRTGAEALLGAADRLGVNLGDFVPTKYGLRADGSVVPVEMAIYGKTGDVVAGINLDFPHRVGVTCPHAGYTRFFDGKREVGHVLLDRVEAARATVRPPRG